MTKYYDKLNNRLVYIGQASNSDFWDRHWDANDLQCKLKHSSYNFALSVTRRFLPKGSIVLEGGCGQSVNVAALQYGGYQTYGVDYASQTVKNVNDFAPNLKVSVADVRKLNFSDGFFDGYWSLGVIEHFYEGFYDIAAEMFRVLKPGGFVFLTCPVMSWLRKKKADAGKYPIYDESIYSAENFYQFALDPRYVIKTFNSAGFKLVKARGFDGVKGVKDEIAVAAPLLHRIYQSPHLPVKIVKKVLDIVFRTFANHMSLFIFTSLKGTSA